MCEPQTRKTEKKEETKEKQTNQPRRSHSAAITSTPTHTTSTHQPATARHTPVPPSAPRSRTATLSVDVCRASLSSTSSSAAMVGEPLPKPATGMCMRAWPYDSALLLTLTFSLLPFCPLSLLQAKHHPDLIMCRKQPGIASTCNFRMRFGARLEVGLRSVAVGWPPHRTTQCIGSCSSLSL